MDVVDLAQPRQRAAGREVERQRAAACLPVAHPGAKPQQQAALGGRRAGDPGADGVDEVEFDQLARWVGRGRAVRDIAAEQLERGHGMASGEDHSTSLPPSVTATIADTMAESACSQTPTRRL